MIEIRQLRFFTVVAANLGIRRAAETLGLKPSTVSHHIRALEEDLGVGLFDRRRGGLELTAAGREFLGYAHRVLFEFDQAIEQAGRLGRAEAGGLGLGIFTSMASGRLRDLLERHRQSFPGVAVRFVEGNRIDLLGRLRDRRLDVVLIAGLLDGEIGIEALPLWDERLMVAMPERHRLTLAQAIVWSDLSRERVMVRTWENGGESLNLVIGKLAIRGHAPDVASTW